MSFLDSGEFVGTFESDDHTGHIDSKIDRVRGQYPKDPASGWVAFATNGLKTSLLTGVSANWFKLEFIVMDNGLGTKNRAVLYDGPGVSVTVAHFHIGPSDTVIIDGLKGIYFRSGVHASNFDSQLRIRVGGYLVKSQI